MISSLTSVQPRYPLVQSHRRDHGHNAKTTRPAKGWLLPRPSRCSAERVRNAKLWQTHSQQRGDTRKLPRR